MNVHDFYLNDKHPGTVIVWNGVFGYIELSENNIAFFHKSCISPESRTLLRLRDKVECKLIPNPKKDKCPYYAKNVTFLSKVKLSEYTNLTAGRVKSWNSKYGFIEASQLPAPVFLFHTRIIESKNPTEPGQVLILWPKKSSKNEQDLFASFAYPLAEERDLEFLTQLYRATSLPEITLRIAEIRKSQVQLSPEQRFLSEISNLGFIENDEDYRSLKTIIDKYKEFFFTPDFSTLRKYCSDAVLIRLLLDDYIRTYDPDMVYRYFEGADIEARKGIFTKLPSGAIHDILNKYIAKIHNLGYLNSTNNLLKQFLKLTSQMNLSDALWSKVKKLLYQNLSESDLIDLFLKGYLNDISEQIPNHRIYSSFNNCDQLEKLSKKPDHLAGIKSFLENEILDFDDFETEYPRLIRLIRCFGKLFKEDYYKVLGILKVKLKNADSFLLYLGGIDIEKNFDDYFIFHQEQLNIYFQILYLMKIDDEVRFKLLDAKLNLNQERLVHEAIGFVNNPIFKIIDIELNRDSGSLLAELKRFLIRTGNTEIKLGDLALSIYKLLPHQSVEKVRFWLYGYVPSNLFDYFEFRTGFKALSKSEKKSYRERTDFILKRNLEDVEMGAIKPCLANLETKNGHTIYKAFLFNIFFANGTIRLCLPNGEYTEEYHGEYYTSGFNRISENDELCKKPIEITVEGNLIIEERGFDAIVSTIYQREVLGSLNKKIGTIAEDYDEISYPEDFILRKQIIDHLEKCQSDLFKVHDIIEAGRTYRNPYTKLNAPSLRIGNLVRLFTLLYEGDVVIVWEDIDLQKERASYIFKCRRTDYETLINRIKHNIASLLRLRSNLLHATELNEQELIHKNPDKANILLFARSMGYVRSIRRSRGKQNAFYLWLDKFTEACKEVTPVLPSPDEMEIIGRWPPPSYTKKTPKVSSGEIDVATIESGNEIEDITGANETVKPELFEIISKFNDWFINNLKTD
ncbi:MAG: hypothetical protein RBS07_17500 [Lentimicrobium sp.]|jgi:hypothetical protein|nr:hypothetical protein [Lentimicrobium sp.]